MYLFFYVARLAHNSHIRSCARSHAYTKEIFAARGGGLCNRENKMAKANCGGKRGVKICVIFPCTLVPLSGSLPSPRAGWCSTNAQQLSSTQWLLYTSSWHRSLAVMSDGISTTLPMPSSLKILTICDKNNKKKKVRCLSRCRPQTWGTPERLKSQI